MKNYYKVCIASSQIEVNDAINFTSTNFFPLPKYLKFVPNDVILLKDNKKIIGTIFLKDKYFFCFPTRTKGTFLTFVCISKQYQNKGLSHKLMKRAELECISRSSNFSIVISRRSVDNFYQKFDYWGIANYSIIKINKLNKLKKSPVHSINNHAKFEPKLIKKFHKHTYQNLHGSIIRTTEDWNIIGKKIIYSESNYITFCKNKNIIGYAIIDKNLEIQEIASSSDYAEFLNCINNFFNFPIVIHASNFHPILNYLYKSDFTISSRHCSYGGNMVKILDKTSLVNINSKDYDLKRFNEVSFSIKNSKFLNSSFLNQFNILSMDQV